MEPEDPSENDKDKFFNEIEDVHRLEKELEKVRKNLETTPTLLSVILRLITLFASYASSSPLLKGLFKDIITVIKRKL